MVIAITISSIHQRNIPKDYELSLSVYVYTHIYTTIHEQYTSDLAKSIDKVYLGLVRVKWGLYEMA